MIKENEIWKQYRTNYKNRIGSLVKDGIVSENDYCGILLFLKEANQNNVTESEWDLSNWLNTEKPKGMWLRVAEWVWGISKTDKYNLPSFESTKTLYESPNQIELQNQIKKIAVININKADGTGTPLEEEIRGRLDLAVKENENLLKQQIALSKPRIVICGNTYYYLKSIYGLEDIDWYNGYIIADLGENKDVLIINSCHPAAHVSAIMSYFGITGIYQQALKNGWQK